MTPTTVIGLEVHVELSTESKAFCGCSTEFGAPPNSQVCPVCLGLPGALPVTNELAVEYAVRAGLALNSEVAAYSRFDRKNYFYPDLPKGYQISQYQYPLCLGGWIDVPSEGSWHRIRITRVHLEEDTGKLTHVDGGSLVDFNRCGVPLLEIVSEPDIRSPEQARAYLQELRTLLSFTGISDLKMEEGSLRCDANISLQLRPDEPGVLVEIKNMNSFRSVKMALEHEVKRQSALVADGRRIARETRHWDEARGITFSSRSKEQAHDYRYFPEPDLPPLNIDDNRREQIRAKLPQLPPVMRRRLQEQGLPEYDSLVLTSSLALAGFFDRAARAYGDPKTVANWVMGDLLGFLNALRIDIAASPVSPGQLADLLNLIDTGRISGKIAKTILEQMCQSGRDPEAIIAELGLSQISDREQLIAIVREVIQDHPGSVADLRSGKEKALGFLVGQVMKRTKGRANPRLVNDLFRQEIDR